MYTISPKTVFQRKHSLFPFFTEGHGTLETDGEHQHYLNHGDTSCTDHDDVQSALLLFGRHVDGMMLSRVRMEAQWGANVSSVLSPQVVPSPLQHRIYKSVYGGYSLRSEAFQVDIEAKTSNTATLFGGVYFTIGTLRDLFRKSISTSPTTSRTRTVRSVGCCRWHGHSRDLNPPA